MEKIELRTTGIIQPIKGQLQTVLQELWMDLYWEPKMHLFGYREVEGLCIDGGREYLTPEGKIYYTDSAKVVEAEIADYVRLAPLAELKLLDVSRHQLREFTTVPKGRDVLWRPDRVLFDLRYHPSRRAFCCDNEVDFQQMATVVVKAKPDGLYCPNHPDKKLVTKARDTRGCRFNTTFCLAWSPGEKGCVFVHTAFV